LDALDVDKRIEAMRDYADSGFVDALPRLRALLEDPHPGLRATARRAVDALAPPAPVPTPPPTAEATAALRAQLAAEDPSTRRAAMEALGWHGDRESIPGIARHLKDPNRDVRRSAAMALCLLGSKEGVATLLEERANLTLVSALRRPEAWARLSGLSAKRGGPLTSPGALKDDVKTWADHCGLRVRWAAGSRGQLLLWRVDWELPSTGLYRPGPGAAGGLAAFMNDGRFGAIVEDAEIRIVPYDVAWTFWRDWLRANP
jgi:hypothetical protein